MLLNIRQPMDDARCYEMVRELRSCDSGQINKRGFHDLGHLSEPDQRLCLAAKSC